MPRLVLSPTAFAGDDETYAEVGVITNRISMETMRPGSVSPTSLHSIQIVAGDNTSNGVVRHHYGSVRRGWCYHQPHSPETMTLTPRLVFSPTALSKANKWRVGISPPKYRNIDAIALIHLLVQGCLRSVAGDNTSNGVKKLTGGKRLSLAVLQLKLQLKDYIQNNEFNPELTFGHFLKQNVNLLDIKRKQFADEISIDATPLSQFINQHRRPPEYMAICLEIHSNNSIPAIYWFKLVEKQRAHELKTDKELRRKELENVHRKLAVTF